MWLQAPNIPCKHGFSTRLGGVSTGDFEGLNLGGGDDDPTSILKNRELSLSHLQLNIANLCNLKQVHGNRVNEAFIGQQEGDALVSSKPNLILAISIADCYPLLFCDHKNKVIGAAHAGWRGTVGKIAESTLHEMIKLGAEKNHIQVAIGQGICKAKFEVGDDVIEQFKNNGFPNTFLSDNKIDLAACNKFVLSENGIPTENIWTMDRCTYEPEFYSYRRDKGKTGRMWAVISQ